MNRVSALAGRIEQCTSEVGDDFEIRVQHVC